jgi:hypothetical protein
LLPGFAATFHGDLSSDYAAFQFAICSFQFAMAIKKSRWLWNQRLYGLL